MTIDVTVGWVAGVSRLQANELAGFQSNPRWSYAQHFTVLTLVTNAARLRGVVIQDRNDGRGF
jgi:hypothetical protein